MNSNGNVRFNNSGFGGFIAQTAHYCAWWSQNPRSDRLYIRRPGRDEADFIEWAIGGWCTAARTPSDPTHGTDPFPTPDGQTEATPEPATLEALRGHHTLEQAEVHFTASGPLGHYVHRILFCDDRIEISFRLTAERPFRLAGCRLGSDNGNVRSGFDADTIFNPSTFLSGFHHHRLTRAQIYETMLFSPPPFCYPLHLRNGTWLAAALEPTLDQLQFSGFLSSPDEAGRLAFDIAYDSHPMVDGIFESPPLVLRFGAADAYESLAVHAEGLVSAGKIRRPQRQPIPWWDGVLVCGWRQQVLVATRDGDGSTLARELACTQALYDNHVEALNQADIPFDILIVDEGWSRTHGLWEPHPDRWPDLRGFIAHQHAQGRRVLLWACINIDGLPEDELYRVDNNFYLDPLNPKYMARIHAVCRQLLGPGPDGLDADGFKFDFTGETLPAGTHHGTRELHGMEYLWERFRLIHDAAKAARPDALLNFQVANPYFAPLHDMTRLNDFWSLPEIGLLDMETRARIATAVNFGARIDVDHVSYGVYPYDGAHDYFRECHRFGNVSLYLSDEDLRDPSLVAAIREGIQRYRNTATASTASRE